MKARVHTDGRVLSIGEEKYPEDGPDVTTFTGAIPGYTRLIDLFYDGAFVVLDPANANAVAADNAKGVRNDRKGRLRNDVADPSARGGMPNLADKVEDVLVILNDLGHLVDEA